jgi:hypothetical protein
VVLTLASLGLYFNGIVIRKLHFGGLVMFEKGGSPPLREKAMFDSWRLHLMCLCASIHKTFSKWNLDFSKDFSSCIIALRHILKTSIFPRKRILEMPHTTRTTFELYTESTSLTREISVAARLVLLCLSVRARDDPNIHWFTPSRPCTSPGHTFSVRDFDWFFQFDRVMNGYIRVYFRQSFLRQHQSRKPLLQSTAKRENPVRLTGRFDLGPTFLLRWVTTIKGNIRYDCKRHTVIRVFDTRFVSIISVQVVIPSRDTFAKGKDRDKVA